MAALDLYDTWLVDGAPRAITTPEGWEPYRAVYVEDA